MNDSYEFLERVKTHNSTVERNAMPRNPQCTRCQLHKTANTVCVYGHGSAATGVMLIGEAPGETEDRSGLPFQGAAGKLLRDTLNKLGLADVYITNIVKCRPPANRTPTAQEVSACMSYLLEEIETVKPKVIVLLGGSALKAFTGKSTMKTARGSRLEPLRSIRLPEETYLMATYHPAAFLHSHNPLILSSLEEDLRRAAGLVNAQTTTFPEHRVRYLYLESSEDEFLQALETLNTCRLLTADCEWSALPNRKICWPWTPGAELFSLTLSGMLNNVVQTVAIALPRQTAAQFVFLKLWLEDKNLVFHNAMADMIWLHKTAFKFNLANDTMLFAYLLDEEQPLALKNLAVTVAGISTEWKQPLWSTRPTDQETWKELLRYNARDTYVTQLVLQGLLAQLKKRSAQEQQGIIKILKHILLPALPAFVEMAHNGVPVDFEALSKAFDIQNDELETLGVGLAMAIDSNHSEDGVKLATSPARTKEFLQRAYGLTLASSNADELRPFASQYPVITTILKARHKSKLIGTYLEPWAELLNEQQDGRLHSVYRLGSVRTGRTSAELEKGGSLQLVPRGDGEEEAWIRKLIAAPQGYLILSADYSQIELRIAAWIADEENMLRAFRNDQDLHNLTASGIVGCAPDKVTKQQRQIAKSVNFGLLYGMGAEKYAHYAAAQYGLHISIEEAARLRRVFFTLYPGLTKWHRRAESDVRRGYTVTPLGRYRHGITELTKAVNTPVQATASDILLRALQQLYEAFAEVKDAQLIGAVHDSVLMLIPDDGDHEGWSAFIRAIMEDPDLMPFGIEALPVPLKVDIKVAKTWGG